MTKPVAWSYTALTSFENCPRQFYHIKVKKDVPDPPGEAALWGQRVHKAFEERLRDGVCFPDTLAGFEKYARLFGGIPGTLLVEQQIALTKDFKPTAWFGKDVWVRAVLDVAVVNGRKAMVADWKTGKRKPDSAQMKLFAGVAFELYPEVEIVDTTFVWLPDKKLDRETFKREDKSSIWQEFAPRVLRLENAHKTGDWPPRPSGLCRKHCAVLSCEHNGRR